MKWLQHLFTSKKTRHRQVAGSLEMVYFEEVDRETMRALMHFPLFQKGRIRNRRISHFTHQYDLSRQTDAYIFDYRYVRGGKTRNQTVFWAISDDLNLPWFAMEPQQFRHTVVKILGRKEIEFDLWPTFNRNYWIEGVDPQAVQYVFGDEVPEFFNKEPGWSVEGYGNQFVLTKLHKRISPEDRPWLLDTGRSVLDRLVPRGKGNLV